MLALLLFIIAFLILGAVTIAVLKFFVILFKYFAVIVLFPASIPAGMYLTKKYPDFKISDHDDLDLLFKTTLLYCFVFCVGVIGAILLAGGAAYNLEETIQSTKAGPQSEFVFTKDTTRGW